MILVRHGLMIVGDPIGGKTSAFKVLAAALGQLHEKKLMDENQVRDRCDLTWYGILPPFTDFLPPLPQILLAVIILKNNNPRRTERN